MQWSHGHFYWNELMTRDAEKAKKFYARHDRLDLRGNADAGRHLLGREDGRPVLSAAYFR